MYSGTLLRIHPCFYFFCRHQLRVGTEFLVQITIQLIPAEHVVRGEGRISVSCSPPRGTGGAQLHLGRVGDQSAREVLFIDKSRQKAASDRDGAMGTDFLCDGSCPGNQLRGGGSARNQSPLRDSRHANSARYFVIPCHRRLHTIFSKERIIRWVRDDVR